MSSVCRITLLIALGALAIRAADTAADGGPPSAADILDQVQSRYAEMNSFASDLECTAYVTDGFAVHLTGRLAVASGAPDRREGKRTVTVTPLFGYERDADKRWLRVLKFVRVPLPAPRPVRAPGADATAGM